MSKKSPKGGPRSTKSGKRRPDKHKRHKRPKDTPHEDKPHQDTPRKAGKRLDEASGEDPGPSPERRSTMQSDTPHPEGHPNLQDSAAAIAPVTDAMMDHAAHEASVLADGVAHGTVALAQNATAQAQAVGETAVQTAGEMSERAAEVGEDAARTAAETTDQALDGAVQAVQIAGSAAQDAGRATKEALERGTEAARDALSASTDALTAYNAKVMEMVRSNLASTTELFAALVQAKSVPEALSLNADHFRRRMEALTTQGRELATLAQRIALDAMQPFKGAADR